MAMVIFSHVEITFYVFMREDNLHVFERKLSLYFIGVCIIKYINLFYLKPWWNLIFRVNGPEKNNFSVSK